MAGRNKGGYEQLTQSLAPSSLSSPDPDSDYGRPARFRAASAMPARNQTGPSAGSTGLGSGDAKNDGFERKAQNRKSKLWRRTQPSLKPNSIDLCRDCDIVEYNGTNKLERHHIVNDGMISRWAKSFEDKTLPDGMVYWVQFKSPHDPAFEPIVTALGLDAHELGKMSASETSTVLETDGYFTVGLTYFGTEFVDEDTPIVTKHGMVAIIFRNVLVTIVDPVTSAGTLARLELKKGKLFKSADLGLLFADLLTITTERNFEVAHILGDRLASLEDDILERTNEESVVKMESSTIANGVHVIKRELLQIRRSLWPIREVLSTLSAPNTGESILSAAATEHLRRSYDSSVQLIEIVETYRELGTNLVELYMAQVGFLLDKQLKLLAMVDFVFLPMTFLTGVYGMNFTYVLSEELANPFGYYWFWIVCTIFAIMSFIVFHRQRWIEVSLFTAIGNAFASKKKED